MVKKTFRILPTNDTLIFQLLILSLLSSSLVEILVIVFIEILVIIFTEGGRPKHATANIYQILIMC